MMVSQMECLSLNLEQEAEPSLYMGLPKFSKSKKEKKIVSVPVLFIGFSNCG